MVFATLLSSVIFYIIFVDICYLVRAAKSDFNVHPIAGSLAVNLEAVALVELSEYCAGRCSTDINAVFCASGCSGLRNLLCKYR